MDHLIQDLRFGMRQLYKHPGFTLAAVLCIALGIGANCATFSFANALPVAEIHGRRTRPPGPAVCQLDERP